MKFCWSKDVYGVKLDRNCKNFLNCKKIIVNCGGLYFKYS